MQGSITQAVRVVNKAGLSVDKPSAQSEIFYLACQNDTVSEQIVILWDDVLDAFKSVVHVRHGARIISFLKGPDLKDLDPLRIAAVSDVILDVVVEGQLTRQKALSVFGYGTDTVVDKPSFASSSAFANLPPSQGTTSPSNTSQPSGQDIPLRTEDDVEPATRGTSSQYNSCEEAHLGSTAAIANSLPPLPGFSSAAEPNNTSILDTNVFASDALAPGKKMPICELLLTPRAKMFIIDPDEGLKEILTKWKTMIEEGVEQPLQQIFACSLEAANNGDLSSQCHVGLLYKNGKGVPKDYTKARRWLLEAARCNHARAQFEVGELYYIGNGVTKDYTEAKKWYLKAANQGLGSAGCRLGYIYKNGQGVSQNYSKAKEWFLKSAGAGHLPSQYAMGEFYFYGHGISKEYGTAREWYLQAAGQGHERAQYSLGAMYHQGLGVQQDYTQARGYFLKSADQGHILSQYSLGILYKHGQGVAQDDTRAMEWFIKAAKDKCPSSQYDIGDIHFFGRGVPRDYKMAKRWYLIAAQQGHASAQYSLGAIYQQGLGVPKDNTKALEWYLMAASQGHNLSARQAVNLTEDSGRQFMLRYY